MITPTFTVSTGKNSIKDVRFHVARVSTPISIQGCGTRLRVSIENSNANAYTCVLIDPEHGHLTLRGKSLGVLVVKVQGAWNSVSTDRYKPLTESERRWVKTHIVHYLLGFIDRNRKTLDVYWTNAMCTKIDKVLDEVRLMSAGIIGELEAYRTELLS